MPIDEGVQREAEFNANRAKPKVEILIEGLTAENGNIDPLTVQGQAQGEKITKPEKVKKAKAPKAPTELSCFGHRQNTVAGDTDNAVNAGPFSLADFTEACYKRHPQFMRLGENRRSLEGTMAKTIIAHLNWLGKTRGIEIALSADGIVRVVNNHFHTGLIGNRVTLENATQLHDERKPVKAERVKHIAMPAETPATMPSAIANACNEVEQAQKSA